ncbi:uncharacterized protein NH340_JMT04678 [Sarcoptes scabiei]|nr:uncharacterized protein NH340_JMT04678 [Sarcoptes scabiei]
MKRLSIFNFFPLISSSIILFHFTFSSQFSLPFNDRNDFTSLLEENDPQYWYEMAKADLEERLNVARPLHKMARNIIIFVGDGMGISTITASRILKGQLKGGCGEEERLEFERFPYSALIKTYNIDKQVPDSAGTATAFLTGVKANFYTLGLSGKIKKNHPDCSMVQKNSVDSIMKWAIDADKATGVVTTTRITHATPAASYAHIQNRDWEYFIDDSIVNENSKSLCKDIAKQLIENQPGKSLNVVLGGGRYSFLPKNQRDPKGMFLNDKLVDAYGKRDDGRNLIDEWLNLREIQGLQQNEYAFVNDTEGLKCLNYNQTKYLLGLFNYTNMEYELLRNREPDGEPSLTEMTEAAIKVLSNHPNGFVLLVEGGRIDHAHHEGFATMALLETLEFERAIRRARELVSIEETLIIVTADHSHSLVINGYPSRGNRIEDKTHSFDDSRLPYTTLIYTNGPGFRTLSQRSEMKYENTCE